MRLSDLLNQVHIEAGDLGSDPEISGFGTLDEATGAQLSFLGNAKYRHLIQHTKAAAILVPERQAEAPCPQIVVPDPYIAMAHILETLFPEPHHDPGIHPSAIVEDGACIDASASIGPFCVISKGANIGPFCTLKAHVNIGQNVSIGERTTLFPHVAIYDESRIGKHVRIHANTTVGSDGYGYVVEHGKHRKIPQVGNVIIGDYVEIGAGTTIDRGALKPTVIGEGSKIDNLVQIAHGVQMGKHCLIVSQAGIAGSATLGNYVVLAGQVGVTGHVHIADQITVMGKSVVTKNLTKPGSYAGNPAIPAFQYQRQLASLRAADKIRGRLSKLEKLFEQKGNDNA